MDLTRSNLLDLASGVVELARSQGADLAEAYVSTSRQLTIEVINQELETIKRAEDRGLGLRVISQGRLGFAFSTELSREAMREVVRQALDNSRNTAPDTYYDLPVASPDYPDLDLYDPEIAGADLERKIAMAREVEAQGRAFDPRVTITESASYQDGEYLVGLVNSRGVARTYQGASCGAYADLVAEEDGESQAGFGLSFRLKFRDLDPARVGREAAQRAVRMLRARSVNTRKAPVVLDPYVATGFLAVLAPALTAEAVQKGKSLLAGKLGSQVASSLVNLIDDGRLPGGLLSAPFDGEGVATKRTVLIKEGQLQSFLYNTYTAAKDGVESTGNGTRGSFKGTPEVGTTNFYLEAGPVSLQRLLGEIGSGLYVTEAMGMHTANPISGDFSVGASGLWIENGEFAYPVRGVAIAGNILSMFRDVDAVADDLTFFVGKGSPTIRIARMTISGS